jgi:hypothetical protein
MALNLFRVLMPAEEDFTPLFCEQAELIVKAATELRQMVAQQASAAEHVATIRALEMSADNAPSASSSPPTARSTRRSTARTSSSSLMCSTIASI